MSENLIQEMESMELDYLLSFIPVPEVDQEELKKLKKDQNLQAEVLEILNN